MRGELGQQNSSLLSSQMEDNVRAEDLKLTAAELAQLDALTKPKFGFPQRMQPM